MEVGLQLSRSCIHIFLICFRCYARGFITYGISFVSQSLGLCAVFHPSIWYLASLLAFRKLETFSAAGVGSLYHIHLCKFHSDV